MLGEQPANARADAAPIGGWDTDHRDEVEATGAEQEVGGDPAVRGAHDPDGSVRERGFRSDGALGVDERDPVVRVGGVGQPVADEREPTRTGSCLDEERLAATETAEPNVERRPAGEEPLTAVGARSGDLGETLVEASLREL